MILECNNNIWKAKNITMILMTNRKPKKDKLVLIYAKINLVKSHHSLKHGTKWYQKQITTRT